MTDFTSAVSTISRTLRVQQKETDIVNDSDRPSASHSSSNRDTSRTEAQPIAARNTGARSNGRPARPRTAWTYIKWTAASLLCLAAMAAGTVASQVWSNPNVREFTRQAFKDPIGT